MVPGGHAFEGLMEKIVAEVIAQQHLSFSTFEEARQHLIKTRKEIDLCFQQGNAMLVEGLHCLQTNSDGHVHGYVASTAAKLQKQLHSSKKLKAVIREILQNQSSLLYFTEAVTALCNRGDFHQEQCVITVLMALFPLNPQPYICYGSMIWRKDGIDAAEVFYTKVIEFIRDPALLYFAADCFIKNGRRDKAMDALQCALAMTEQSNDLEGRRHLLESLERL